MALIVADRTKETTTTSGTGTINLAGAVDGFQTFVAGIGTGNTCHYCIVDGTSWEVGLGTVTDASPDTLSRDSIIASSNAGAAITLSGGTATVFCTLPGNVTRIRQALSLVPGTDVQAYSANLLDLASQWSPASSADAAWVDFHEDTDNGTNFIRLVGAASMAGNETLRLPTISSSSSLVSAASSSSNLGSKDNAILRANGTGGTTAQGQTSDLGPVINDDGSVVNTVQPCVIAMRSADVANVTGDGTVYAIICDTEVKDQGGDYDNTTGVLTAPVGGSYQISGIAAVGTIDSAAADDFAVQIITSNRTYSFYFAETNDIPTSFFGVMSQLCDMDANDTAYLATFVTGMAKTCTLRGSANQSKFEAVLIC